MQTRSKSWQRVLLYGAFMAALAAMLVAWGLKPRVDPRLVGTWVGRNANDSRSSVRLELLPDGRSIETSRFEFGDVKDESPFHQYWTVKGRVLSFDRGNHDPVTEAQLYLWKQIHEVWVGAPASSSPLHTYEIISVTDDTLHLKYTGTRMSPPPAYELKRVEL